MTYNIPKHIDRTEARSSKYQWIIVEQPVSTEIMSGWLDSESLYKLLNPISPEKLERIADLKDQLYCRLWQVVQESCTEIQRQVITLYYKEGYTQVEIAKMRGRNQSSCVKSLVGNATYYGDKKNYGGALPKLKRVLTKDSKFQAILAEIKELQDE